MSKPDNKLLWKYAGLATQFVVAIGLAVYGGLWFDKWMKIKIPLAVWVLPLLVIVAVIIKIIKDTAQKK
jgi:hypothetical protein